MAPIEENPENILPENDENSAPDQKEVDKSFDDFLADNLPQGNVDRKTIDGSALSTHKQNVTEEFGNCQTRENRSQSLMAQSVMSRPSELPALQVAQKWLIEHFKAQEEIRKQGKARRLWHKSKEAVWKLLPTRFRQVSPID
jgi:hypothetical protein